MYVYRFLNKEGEIIYVGKSKNVISRVINHNNLSEKCYEEVEFIDFAKLNNETERDIYEVYYINKYSPKYNKKDNRRDDITGLPLLDIDFKHKINKDILKYRKKLKKGEYYFINEIEQLDFLDNFDFKAMVTETHGNEIELSTYFNEDLNDFLLKDIKNIEEKYEKLNSQKKENIMFDLDCINSICYLHNVSIKSDNKNKEEINKFLDYIYDVDFDSMVRSSTDPYYHFRWFYDFAHLYEIGINYENLFININTYHHFIYVHKNEVIFIKNNFKINY